MKSIGRILERFFPLPPPEQRRPGIIPLSWAGGKLRVERDGDYLTYILFELMLIVNMLFLGILLCDNYAGTKLLVSPGAFSSNRLLIAIVFSRFVAWPTLIVSVLFYLRIRSAIDLQHEMPPRVIRKWALENRPRWKWIAKAIVGEALMVWGLFNFEKITLVLIHHLYVEQNLLLIVIVQSVVNLGLTTLPPMLISLALWLEKAIRFFPEAQQDLLRPDYE
jgi:hypothetical protein